MLTLFTSNGEVIDILQRVIVEDNVHTFLYMLYMLNKLTTSRQVTTDLNSSREGRDIVRQVLGEEAYSDLVIFLQQDSARPFTLDGWQVRYKS
ncbi:hypothetical protein EON65_20865 [archaeon]|nr:MAG: hypothetical protein EON65_20865 [archaeon]